VGDIQGFDEGSVGGSTSSKQAPDGARSLASEIVSFSFTPTMQQFRNRPVFLPRAPPGELRGDPTIDGHAPARKYQLEVEVTTGAGISDLIATHNVFKQVKDLVGRGIG
jgi:hypothetical protein